MNWGKMGRRGHVRPLLTLTLTVILVFGFGFNLAQNGIANNQSADEHSRIEGGMSDQVPQTQKELEQLMSNLSDISPKKKADRNKLRIPFSGFIANRGQEVNDLLKYYYDTDKSFIGFEDSKINIKQQIIDPNYDKYGTNDHLIGRAEVLHFDITFIGSNVVEPKAEIALKHSTNYFTETGQLMDIKSYEEIWFYNLYTGIDLRYIMSDQGLKYEFILDPGANPDDINIRISDTARVSVSDNQVSIYSKPDNIEIIVDTDLIVFNKGSEKSISSAFKIIDAKYQVYGFDIGIYDSSKTLVIDPYLFGFSTFLGTSADEYAKDVGVDNVGNIFILGSNGKVYKLNPSGSQLLWVTALGSNVNGNGLAVDSLGNVYVTGGTPRNWWLGGAGGFFTTPGAYDTSRTNLCGGPPYWEQPDTFISKLFTNGTLAYGTYLGGTYSCGIDYGIDIAVDSSGNAYILGSTGSSSNTIGSGTIGAYDTSYNGGTDLYIAKFNSDGSWRIYLTYFGGTGDDFGSGIALDSANNVHITGYTQSTNFPKTSGAYDESKNSGDDAFYSKLSLNGGGSSDLIYSTFIGGSGDDYGKAITVDDSGYAYITGITNSSSIGTEFPISSENVYNPDHSSLDSSYDAFVTKINASGSTLADLIYSTYIGGSGDDYGNSITVDSSGYVYIIGTTEDSSTDFPTTTNAINTIHNNNDGGNDVFFSRLTLDNNGSTDLVYSTFLGGTADDAGYGIIFKSSNIVYIVGDTQDGGNDFPTTLNSVNRSHNGPAAGSDMFVVKLILDGTVPEFTSTATNFNFQQIDTANTLTWDIGDPNPDFYNVTFNNGSIDYLLTEEPNWHSNTTINVQVDFKVEGTYTVKITLVNKAGNYNTHIVTVIVDETDPVFTYTPSDLYYKPGETGNTLKWEINDFYPAFYNITLINTSVIQSTIAWTNNTIEINVDGYEGGIHTFNITIIDKAGNYKSDIVNLTVNVNVPSFDIFPNDRPYELGDTGNTISWTILDEDPDYYNITVDGIIISNYTQWYDGIVIEINIDGLAIGTHTVEISLIDHSGNPLKHMTIIDVSDNTSPTILEPDHISSYELGSSGHTISWTANDWDDQSLNYEIYLNASLFNSSIWYSGQAIIIDIDGLSLGFYNFTIIFYDGSGNYQTDIVLVTIVDTTNPTITQPKDILYEVQSIGNVIKWTATDLDESNYIIFRNGSEIKIGDWTNEDSISFNIDGLTLGNYNFTIIIFDGSGNYDMDTVIVKVILIDTGKPSFNFAENQLLNQEVKAGGMVTIVLEDDGVIDRIEYSWDNGELITLYYTNSTLTLNQVTNTYYFHIPVPKDMKGSSRLRIIAYDETGNFDTFFIDISINRSSEGSSNIPQEVLLGIIIASVLAVSTATFRLRQRRKMDKAFDELQSDFEGSEITGEGKDE